MKRLLPIVEGDGDSQAVPVLIRKVLDHHGRYDVQVLKAQSRGEWPRVKRQLDRFFLSARLENAPILWVLDFDCLECVDPEIERDWFMAQANRLDREASADIVFLVKEYESLFLWDPEALRSAFPELPANHSLPADPESVRDAKGWISRSLPPGRAYKPTSDQARISSRLDLELLRDKSPSFQRFEAAVLALTN